MKITDIECHVLLVPDVNEQATSSAQDDIVVLVRTDEGITGIGETDVNPWIARSCIEARGTHTMGLGLKEMLIGESPTVAVGETAALHRFARSTACDIAWRTSGSCNAVLAKLKRAAMIQFE